MNLVQHAARRLDYAKYLCGLRKSVHVYGDGARPRKISILIPDSAGDVAINASVTRSLKRRHPDTGITLISHPRYLPVADLNPDYDDACAFPEAYLAAEPSVWGYRDQIDIAERTSPDMDILYLCQPSAWCDHIVPKFTMLDLQNHLCGIPPDARLPPKLTLKPEHKTFAETCISELPRPAIVFARKAFTVQIGGLIDEFWKSAARLCIDRGMIVLDNATSSVIDHASCIPIGNRSLVELVAIAGKSRGFVSLRSGASDLVGFATDTPQYAIYPKASYRYSKTSFLDWCSLRSMGVTVATEVENSFVADADLELELSRLRDWLDRNLHASE